jgi:hypothetical protein
MVRIDLRWLFREGTYIVIADLRLAAPPRQRVGTSGGALSPDPALACWDAPRVKFALASGAAIAIIAGRGFKGRSRPGFEILPLSSLLSGLPRTFL